MPKTDHRRKKSRHRGVSARANADLMAHIASLGLATVETYRAWCREHGITGALSKRWQERRYERQLAQKLADRERSDEALDHHISELGLESVEAYRAWCRRHGLSDYRNKGEGLRKKELGLILRQRSEAALAGRKRHSRRPGDIIWMIYDRDLDGASLNRQDLRKIHDAFVSLEGDDEARACYLGLLLHCEKNADLLGVKPAVGRLGPQEGNTFVEGLAALARWRDSWLRPLEEWMPDSHNSRRQFGSLARHLLARYAVPRFMDVAWFQMDSEETRRQQGWFVHVGVGGNIRTADIPVHLTKKMAHLFLQAPDAYTIEEALRWGQVLGLGGEVPLVRAINETRLGSTFECEPFWKTVIHFFVNNPMLDPDQVGPVVDYLYNQKYVPQEIVQPGGVVDRRLPAQPNLGMKGRSADKLVRQVEAWHR